MRSKFGECLRGEVAAEAPPLATEKTFDFLLDSQLHGLPLMPLACPFTLHHDSPSFFRTAVDFIGTLPCGMRQSNNLGRVGRPQGREVDANAPADPHGREGILLVCNPPAD